VSYSALKKINVGMFATILFKIHKDHHCSRSKPVQKLCFLFIRKRVVFANQAILNT